MIQQGALPVFIGYTVASDRPPWITGTETVRVVPLTGHRGSCRVGTSRLRYSVRTHVRVPSGSVSLRPPVRVFVGLRLGPPATSRRVVSPF